MPRQLVLLEPPGADWRLDERTKELGRRGIAEARRILERAARAQREAAPRGTKPAA